jgi:hypothetical protein
VSCRFQSLSTSVLAGFLCATALAQEPRPFVFVLDAGADFFGQCPLGRCWFGNDSFNSPCEQLSGNKNTAPFSGFTFAASKTATSNSATATLQLVATTLGSNTMNQGGSLSVYALGPPDTSFHLDVTRTGSAVATLSAGTGSASAGSILGVRASQTGSAGTAHDSKTQSVPVDGTTTSSIPPLGCFGRQYTYATAISLFQVSADMEGFHPTAGSADALAKIMATGYLVRPNQTPPTAGMVPLGAVIAGSTSTLDALGPSQPRLSHANTPGATLTEYRWDVRNPSGDTEALLGPAIQYRWLQTGLYQVTLKVTDSDGLTGTTVLTVNALLDRCDAGLLPTRLNLRTLITASCPPGLGDVVIETIDVNNDGHIDYKVMNDVMDDAGNKVEVWCLGNSGSAEYRMFYTPAFGAETYLAGRCPYCGGWNRPIDLYFGRTASTNRSCILSTRWMSTEGGSAIDPNTNSRFADRGSDCSSDGIISFTDTVFDTNSLTRIDREGHRSQPIVTSVRAYGPSDPQPPLGSIPTSSTAMVIGKLHPADLNGDGFIDARDVAIIQAALGSSVGQSRFDVRADLDGNGVVNLIDYQLWFASTKLP